MTETVYLLTRDDAVLGYVSDSPYRLAYDGPDADEARRLAALLLDDATIVGSITGGAGDDPNADGEGVDTGDEPGEGGIDIGGEPADGDGSADEVIQSTGSVEVPSTDGEKASSLVDFLRRRLPVSVERYTGSEATERRIDCSAPTIVDGRACVTDQQPYLDAKARELADATGEDHEEVRALLRGYEREEGSYPNAVRRYRSENDLWDMVDGAVDV
ncbi:hypothetical protein BRD17_06550 [Halobacteriales archaeon SW_7_68_16]|nr:MAG: hypothetical protein BRD17_06550 [Halobacteriales archaeon SW_7_68_16]